MFHGPLSRAYQLEALDTKVLVGVELRAPVNVKEMRIRVKMDRLGLSIALSQLLMLLKLHWSGCKFRAGASRDQLEGFLVCSTHIVSDLRRWKHLACMVFGRLPSSSHEVPNQVHVVQDVDNAVQETLPVNRSKIPLGQPRATATKTSRMRRRQKKQCGRC